MIRIKTVIENVKVYTINSLGIWYTMTMLDGKHTDGSSYSAHTLYDAGTNHLTACQKIKGNK